MLNRLSVCTILKRQRYRVAMAIGARNNLNGSYCIILPTVKIVMILLCLLNVMQAYVLCTLSMEHLHVWLTTCMSHDFISQAPPFFSCDVETNWEEPENEAKLTISSNFWFVKKFSQGVFHTHVHVHVQCMYMYVVCVYNIYILVAMTASRKAYICVLWNHRICYGNTMVKDHTNLQYGNIMTRKQGFCDKLACWTFKLLSS